MCMQSFLNASLLLSVINTFYAQSFGCSMKIRIAFVAFQKEAKNSSDTNENNNNVENNTSNAIEVVHSNIVGVHNNDDIKVLDENNDNHVTKVEETIINNSMNEINLTQDEPDPEEEPEDNEFELTKSRATENHSTTANTDNAEYADDENESDTVLNNTENEVANEIETDDVPTPSHNVDTKADVLVIDNEEVFFYY